MRPLTCSLPRGELLLGDALGVQAGELGADHLAGLLDVVGSRVPTLGSRNSLL